MRRYLTTLKLFWSASLAAEMEYRANFVLATGSAAATLAGALFALWALLRTDYAMNGWGFYEALIVVGVYTVLDGLQQTLLQPNRQQITGLVREGTLDFILLKPLDTQFWLSVRKVSIWGVPNVVLGAGLIVFAGLRTDPTVPAVGYLRLLVPLLLGIAILYALGYLLSTLTIWFTKMDNITYAMQALLEAGRYPVGAYPMAYRVFFTFVMPVAFMTTVPAEAMLGRAGGASVALAGAIAVLLLVGCRSFWRYALRHYTSASS
ncbi:MAG: ABC-2 family transporter protein [Planctomycetota bacterium]